MNGPDSGSGRSTMSDIHPVGVILAAGKGTRMKSDMPKGLHRVAGLPMVELVGRAMREAGLGRVIVVIGHGGEELQEALGDRYEYVWQREQLGTGHAALMTRSAIGKVQGPVIIAPGDAPLIRPEVFACLLEVQPGHACVVASAELDNPHGYGRIVRGPTGKPLRIVEEKDARPEQKQIKEVNAAIYCFDGPTLFKYLPTLKNSNAQGEYYLTELVEVLSSANAKLEVVKLADSSILVGVNDRWQLAQAEKAFRTSVLKKHALNGITFLDPDTTFVGPDVEVGADCVIEAGTQLIGNSKVGKGSRVGPYSRIEDSTIGDDCRVVFSQVVGSKIGSGSAVGPFANVRPGTETEPRVRIGNFVEVKNSRLEGLVSVSHLSYIGDAQIGFDTNIGAGVITCNYDGFEKHRTIIGKNCFIGSNATLVAPVTVGDEALIAAGSTVTKDVPAEAGAFGRARQENKEGWYRQWKAKRQAKA